METIRRNGLSFLEETLENKNEYFLIAKELIENLFFDMSKLSTKYCNDIFCEFPYIFSERTLSSILLPALSKLCNSLVFAEMPQGLRCHFSHTAFYALPELYSHQRQGALSPGHHKVS